jgi:hypothetical protein
MNLIDELFYLVEVHIRFPLSVSIKNKGIIPRKRAKGKGGKSKEARRQEPGGSSLDSGLNPE